MNYHKIFFSFLGIFLLNSLTLKPALESYALFQEGDKKVLVLGDIHACAASPESSIAKLDGQDSDIIFSFIHKNSNLPSSSKFILEASESNLTEREALRKLCAYKDLYYSLPYYARENNYLVGSISFSLGDNRPSVVRNLVEMFTVLDNPSFQNPHIFFAIKDKLKALFKEQGTILDFFSQVKSLIRQLKIDIKNEAFSKIAPFLEKILSKIRKYKKLGKSSFTQEELKTSYVDVFASRYLATQDICSLTNPLYQWILPLVNKVIDSNFIIELVKALENHNQVILFVGNNHAVTLHKFLKYYGFESKCMHGLNTKNKGPAIFSGPRFSRDNLSSFLSTVFNRHEDITHIKNCALCHKPDCTKRCGNCRTTYYCSVKCQQENWALHKLNCTKQK